MKKYLKNLLSFSMFCFFILTLLLQNKTVNAATSFTFVDSNNIAWEYTLYGGCATNVRLASNV
ncbi:hypothetical protein, partial [Lachnotalea glycerini]